MPLWNAWSDSARVETWDALPFHIDHIIAEKHGGKTVAAISLSLVMPATCTRDRILAASMRSQASWSDCSTLSGKSGPATFAGRVLSCEVAPLSGG